MTPLDSIVFDLDGTLWDTCDACAAAWNIVLARGGISFREITGEDVRAVTGRSHEECIRVTFAGLPEQEVAWLVEETMTEDVVQIRATGGGLYVGVAEGLRRLSDRYRLAIVSNCQSGYIEMFFELSGLGALFTDIECWGNTGAPKSENLRRVIERNGFAGPIMVGDTPGDQKAAVDNGIPFAFVSYGFQQCEGVDWQFDSFDELARHFLS